MFLKSADVNHCLPNWQGFNVMANSLTILKKSSIQYLPVIESSSTDLSTVNEVSKRSLEFAEKLILPKITIVFEQVIYCKAQQIRWSNQLLLKKTVVRLGEFHICKSFFKILGKRFCEAG